MGFCPSGVLSDGVLSDGVLSEWGFVLKEAITATVYCNSCDYPLDQEATVIVNGQNPTG